MRPMGPRIASGRISMGDIVYKSSIKIVLTLGFDSMYLNPSGVRRRGAYLKSELI